MNNWDALASSKWVRREVTGRVDDEGRAVFERLDKSTYLEESFSFLCTRWWWGGHVVSFFLFGPRSSRHRCRPTGGAIGQLAGLGRLLSTSLKNRMYGACRGPVQM